MKKEFGFVLAAAILLAGCGQKKETTTTTARPVKTTIVESRSIIRKDFSGIVEAVEYVKLAFRVNGQIIQLPVIEGQKVKKGQLIAAIDPRDIALQYAATKSAYETASAQVERNKRLLSRQAISVQEYEISLANFQKAKSEYELSANNMRDTKLTAPFDGSIEKRLVENYQRVNSGEGIVQLVNTHNLRIKFTIPDAYLYLLRAKDPRFLVEFALGLAITLIFGASALNALSTNAVFNILFFLMLVVFAASFFGAFELTLPSKWSNAVDSKAEATSGLLSIFLMAFTLSLVSFSCTGPIIGFLLVQVSTTGSVIAPAIGMLGFAIALALPFTLFALFPSWLKSMPKSGGWMNVIKVTLGFLELAFALKFLSVADLAYGWRILDRETFLALWIVIFGLMGLYLLGKIKFPHDGDENRVGVGRFFLALVSLAFAVYMIPGLWGAPLKAVSAFAPPVMTQDFNLYSNEVHPKFKDYEIGMEYARQQGMPVMIDFTGYGCVNCRKMETAVWTDSKVGGIINDEYVLISLYVDDKTPLNEPINVVENGTERTLRTVGDKWSYLQRVKFGANAQPFYVLLDNDGNPLNKSYAYNEDIPKYMEFLQEGLERYVK